MSDQYFELEDDLEIPGRWYLRHLMDEANNKFDAREFRYGNRIDPGPPLRCGLWNEEMVVTVSQPLTLYHSHKGMPLDFTYTDSEMPVATKRVAKILGEIANLDIQRFPVKVDCMDELYEIINVVSVVDCLDTARSEIKWFEKGNDVRPDLAGKPWSVSSLFVDPNRVGRENVFRIKDYTRPVIVSDVVKQLLEQIGVLGVKFKLVS